MAAPSTSKIVCLRAFNEDLAAKPWQSQTVTPPPPIPKRIAWPGGKIVSNKDEALASFLRRKLNQGQKLTPEQLAMLAKMTTDSESGETPKVVAAASNKNIKRKFGGDAWRSSGDGAIATVEARSLLHKLERKVAQSSSSSCSSGSDDIGDFAGVKPPAAKRRTVDLSSLKGMANSSRSNSRANARAVNVDKRWLEKTVQQQATVATATAASTSWRRVVLDGPGSFSITSSPKIASGNSSAVNSATSVASKTTTFSVRLQSENNDSNGSIMGMANADAKNRVLIAASELDGDSNNFSSVGGGSNSKRARVSLTSIVPAKAAAGVPAVYRKAGLVSCGSRGRGHKGKAFSAGRGGRGGKGLKNDAGRGVGGGGRGGERSLEDLMSGGLASSRR